MNKSRLTRIMTIEELKRNAIEVFRETFHCSPDVATYAPGRVNLIGEHTDYNYGYVFPMALPLVTVVVGKRNDKSECRIFTTADKADDPKYTIFQLPTPELPYNKTNKPKWANYVKGVIANFHGKVEPFDAVYVTSVPLGSGVSSSASLQVATYLLLEQLDGGPNSQVSINDKVLACEDAEHEYAGLPCGLMDQYISMIGREGFIHLIDCRSLECKDVVFSDPDVVILLTDSNVHHQLTDTAYADRQKQCEMAAKVMNRKSLREVKEEDLECFKDKLDGETYKRVLHVLTENARTLAAKVALERKDYSRLGKLMVDSHNSLRDDYEVSCPELDQLVTSAIEVDGVYGSRLTGGGFGGCTVTMLKRSAVQNTISHMTDNYDGTPTFYLCSPSAGAKAISIDALASQKK